MSSVSTPRLLARSLANAKVPLVSWWARRKDTSDALVPGDASAVSRRSLGMRAELAALEARAKAYEQNSERELAGSCWAELSRAQVARKSRYDLAIPWARRALELKDDSALREELASWLEGVGEWQRAATLLLPVREPGSDSERLRLFRRVASLYWRSGQAELAAQALAEIARIDPNSTEPLESLAALHCCAEDVVSRERAVLAQLEAARRFQQHGARLLAFEAELRAFEIDSSSLPAVERLAATLNKLGRREAADDVWRECARTANDRNIHRQLVEKALARNEPECALVASLDALDDALLDIDTAQSAAEFALNPTGTPPKTFDGVLARTGLYGWLSARLDIAIAEDRTSRSGLPHLQLTRLFASVMGRTDWAIECLSQAILVEPRSSEPRRMLELSTTDSGDGNELLRALVNAARIARTADSQLWLASEFLERHRRGLEEPGILVWALRTKLRESLAGSIDPNALADWQSRKAREQSQWQSRWSELNVLSEAEKILELERSASKLILDPEAFESVRDICLEWLRLSANSPVAVEQLARLVDALAIAEHTEEPGTEWRAALAALVQSRSERACLSVARFWLRRAKPGEALAAVVSALGNPEPSQRLLGWVITLSRRLVEKPVYANAIAALSKTTDASLGSSLLVQAAEFYAELGSRDRARKALDSAASAAPASARLAALEINLLDRDDPRIVAEILERALSVVPPRADYALKLAESHERLGNPELALAWALRASTLRPGSLALRERVAMLAIAARDPARLTDWLVQSLEIPVVATLWLPTAARVLRALTEVDAPRAAEVTRRLVAVLGAANPEWRAALLGCAESVADARLAIDILERAAATPPVNPDVLKDIVRRNLKLGDIEAAIGAASRALKAGLPPSTIRKWLPSLEVESFEIPGTELAAAELVRDLSIAEGQLEQTVQSGRRLALDRYRLANDESAALELWSELLKLDHVHVVDWVAEDLATCFGHRPAALHLRNAVELAPNAMAKGRLYAASAHLSAQMGDVDIARVHVEQALSADPGNIRALFIAESLADDDSHQRWLDELYDLVVRATLGSFGERAVHYRAAKVLQALGSAPRALKHACLALVAIPSESTTLSLAATLAREVGDAAPFVDAVLAVAKRANSDSGASRWLDLAQKRLAGPEFIGSRMDLLLHLLAIEPTASLVAMTADVAMQLSADAAANVRPRLTTQLREKLKDIEGPSGARLALSIAEAASRFDDRELCGLALASAIRGDAAIDEYEFAKHAVNWLATDAENAKQLLADSLDFLERPYTNVGLAVLKSLGLLQLRAGDKGTHVRLAALVSRIDEDEAFAEWLSEVIQEPETNAESLLSVIEELVASRLKANGLDPALELLAGAIKAHPRSRLAYDLAMQAVALLLKQRSLADAQRWIQLVREFLTPVNAASIELELARMTGDTLFLVQALAHRAYSDPSSASEGVEYLVEATKLADRLGHSQAALDCAKAAVKWDPKHIGARLALAVLSYKSERAVASTLSGEVRSLLKQLLSNSVARDEDEELRSFLLAEAMDEPGESQAALGELVRAQARVGERPLVCLGLAERLAGNGDAAALPLFDAAISGDLRGLRSNSDVCIQAAEFAQRLGSFDVALRWLNVARAEPNCPQEVLRRADALQAQAVELRRERAEQVLIKPEPKPHPSTTRVEVKVVDEAVKSPIGAEDESLEIPLVRRRSEQPLEAPKTESTIDQALISPETDPRSLEEAIERASFMMTHASPSYQTLTLLRRWLRRWPNSTKLMEYVRDAANVERDIPLSRAVEHVRGVLANLSEQLDPPELGSQPIVPEAVRALLTRDVTSSTGEALATIGEECERFLQRDLVEYGVTGLDRIIPNSGTALGRAFGEVSSRFGLLRTPLFHKRGAQPARSSLALAAPTSLLVEGELPREDSELIGLIAGPLWVTQPEYSIIMGASVQQARAVIVALQVAFGPPQRRPPTNYGEALKIAEKLWEVVPPAAQRRLRDICVESLDYGRALEVARRVDRRAGLYATGDFRWAIEQLSQQQQRNVLATITDPDIAERDPNTADLLRLATSAEYAAVRWQPSKGSELRIPVYPR